MRRIQQHLQPELTVFIVPQRQHELVQQLHAHTTIRTAPAEYERTTRAYLSVLGSFEPRFVRSLREPEAWQTRSDNMEAGMAFPRRCQERKDLLHLEKVTWP